MKNTLYTFYEGFETRQQKHGDAIHIDVGCCEKKVSSPILSLKFNEFHSTYNSCSLVNDDILICR